MLEILFQLLVMTCGLYARRSGGIPGNAIVQVNAENLRTLDEFVDNLIQCRRIPGLSLSVMTSHRVLHEKGYGLADVASHTEVHPTDTIFPIASNTKSFTATLLAILLEGHPKK